LKQIKYIKRKNHKTKTTLRQLVQH